MVRRHEIGTIAFSNQTNLVGPSPGFVIFREVPLSALVTLFGELVCPDAVHPPGRGPHRARHSLLHLPRDVRGQGQSVIRNTTVYCTVNCTVLYCTVQVYDEKSDIWALGCILYEMAALQKTFEGSNLPALVNKIMKGQFAPIRGNYTPLFKQLVRWELGSFSLHVILNPQLTLM